MMYDLDFLSVTTNDCVVKLQKENKSAAPKKMILLQALIIAKEQKF